VLSAEYAEKMQNLRSASQNAVYSRVQEVPRELLMQPFHRKMGEMQKKTGKTAKNLGKNYLMW